jgi:hypothetical protein
MFLDLVGEQFCLVLEAEQMQVWEPHRLRSTDLALHVLQLVDHSLEEATDPPVAELAVETQR